MTRYSLNRLSQWSLSLAVALSLLAASAAHASEPKPAAMAKAGEAQVHYKAGRFDAAVKGFRAAWQLDPRVGFRWGVAKSYDAKGKALNAKQDLVAARAAYVLALEVYQRIPEMKLRGKAAKYEPVAKVRIERITMEIVAIDQALKGDQMTAKQRAELARAREAAADAEKAAADAEKAAADAEKARLEAIKNQVTIVREGPNLLVPGIISSSAGLILASVGAYFLVDAGAIRDDVTAKEQITSNGAVVGITQEEASARRATADDQDLIGAVTLGVGGAALVTGLVLILLDVTSDEPAVPSVKTTFMSGGVLVSSAWNF